MLRRNFRLFTDQQPQQNKQVLQLSVRSDLDRANRLFYFVELAMHLKKEAEAAKQIDNGTIAGHNDDKVRQ